MNNVINKQNLTKHPFIDELFYSFRIRKILHKRDISTVKNKWREIGIDFDTQCVPIFNIFEYFCAWNSIAYYPDDEFSWIAKSYTIDMFEVSILMDLEEQFNVEIEFKENMTMADLVRSVLSAMPPDSNSSIQQVQLKKANIPKWDSKLGIVGGIIFTAAGVFFTLTLITTKTTAPHDHLLPYKYILSIITILFGIVTLLYYYTHKRKSLWLYLIYGAQFISGIIFCYLSFQYYHTILLKTLMFLAGIVFICTGIFQIYRLAHKIYPTITE